MPVDWERRFRTLQDAACDDALVMARVDPRAIRARLTRHGWKGIFVPGEGECWTKVDHHVLRVPPYIDASTHDLVRVILRMLANEEHSAPCVVLESLIHQSEAP